MIRNSIRGIHTFYLDLSHCAHGAAWLSAIGAMVLDLRIYVWHPPPALASARGGVAMESSLTLLLLFISACSLFFPLFRKNEERRSMSHVPLVVSTFGGFELGPKSLFYYLVLQYITHNSRA